MKQTVAEKIFSRKAGFEVFAGDIITAEVDACLTNDASGPLMIDYFRKMQADRVAHPERVAAILDHYVPCPNSRVAALQQSLFDFRDQYGIRLVDAGEGIAHQVFDELGMVRPGSLIVGGDSHTTTHGYLNCVAVGVGASDLACAVSSGELWFKVPQSIRVDFTGTLRPGVQGKDVALYLLSRLGSSGANYKAVEFGDGVSALSIADRKTICNLLAEACAKCAIMPFDETAQAYCRERGIGASEAVFPDEGCSYCERLVIDLSAVSCMLSVPHSVANAKPVAELAGTPIEMAVMGTCTNGRLEDFEAIAPLLKKTDRPFCVQTLVIPASRSIYAAITENGIASLLLKKGAMLLPPGCGPCCGSSPGVPRDGFRVISSANRNFLGRMGNTKASIYLASPRVVIASALAGCITQPQEGSDDV